LFRLIQEAEEHRLDQRGVRLIGHWIDDAHLYSVSEAPDPESVREKHAEHGLTCTDFHQLEGLHGLSPGSADVDRLVREAIARIWGGEGYPSLGAHQLAGLDHRERDQNVKQVLVVDDEEPIRAIVAEALSDEGYRVLTAPNGADALELVRAAEPDGVLLDLMMPVLDGWGFLNACRQEELCGKTPVLVMSAYRKLAEAAPTELRVDRYLAKPFEIDDLIEAVKELVA
jgi:CheY-like chemotaxis protein